MDGQTERGLKNKTLQKPRFEKKARSEMKSSHKVLRRKGLLDDFHSVIGSLLRPSIIGFLDGSADTEFAFIVGDAGEAHSMPGLGRSPGEGNGNPLQYSCLKNPMDRGASQVTVGG